MVKVHEQPCDVHGLDHVLTEPWTLTMVSKSMVFDHDAI